MAFAPMSWYRPALLKSLRGGYTKGDFASDLLAGILVGVVSVPLSMGLAIASGCKPEQGLYTAIIGGFLIALLGGSRYQIGGPAGAFVGLCAAGVSQFGYDGLALATLMSGVIILCFSLFRLGGAISYIPIPVVVGFTTGIAVIIASTQLGPALGIPSPPKPFAHFHERMEYLWLHRGDIAWQPLVVCGATALIIIILRRVSVKIPGALVALVVVGGVVALLGWDTNRVVSTIGSEFGDIPHTLPAPHFPSFGLKEGWTFTDLLGRLRELSGLAFALALLGSIESLLSAVVADGMSGDRHDSNTELFGQGIANVFSPLFFGLPATGVIARTSTNIRAGARSPFAAMIHALVVLIIMVALASMVVHVPMACLAGVLFVVCWSMSEIRHWPHILHAGRSDAMLLPIAFLMTVMLDLTWAVIVGVLLSMIFFSRRMAETVSIEPITATNDQEGELLAGVPTDVEVYDIRGPFFFGRATLIRDLDSESGTAPKVLILRMKQVPFIDATAAFSLRELISSTHRKGGKLIFCDMTVGGLRDLTQHRLHHDMQPDALSPDLATALITARQFLAERAIQ